LNGTPIILLDPDCTSYKLTQLSMICSNFPELKMWLKIGDCLFSSPFTQGV
jgi:hypothetical protein